MINFTTLEGFEYSTLVTVPKWSLTSRAWKVDKVITTHQLYRPAHTVIYFAASGGRSSRYVIRDIDYGNMAKHLLIYRGQNTEPATEGIFAGLD